MFGYVRTASQELRLREYSYYRALYCGLCKRMGKCTGQCSRLTLSYDFVFLAAVRMEVTKEAPTLKRERCLLHPIRARSVAQKCAALDYAANASALLCYHKLFDDIHDEKGAKKIGALLARPFLHTAYRKAKKRYPALDALIAEQLRALLSYENQTGRFESAEAPAEQFGKLMEAVFSEGLSGSEARIAAAIGKNIGHWIYLIDAADDFEEDRKKKRFNPYFTAFGEDPSDEDWQNLLLATTARLCDAERAFLLIDDGPSVELKEILSNILYLGLPATAKQITEKHQKKKPSSDQYH